MTSHDSHPPLVDEDDADAGSKRQMVSPPGIRQPHFRRPKLEKTKAATHASPPRSIPTRHSRTAYAAKRSLDIAAATTLLVFSTPLLATIAVLIRFSSEGQIVYGQQRIGRHGKPFRLWKFRTMHDGAEDILEDYLNAHPDLRGEWESQMSLTCDPRVTPYVGTFLRKSSLDELPQLWNVLKGDMSLVGPRPLPEYHLKIFDWKFRRHREQVLPGVTGIWQVAFRGSGDQQAYIDSDNYYIQNWSLWLDAKILVRTVAAVLSGRGAN